LLGLWGGAVCIRGLGHRRSCHREARPRRLKRSLLFSEILLSSNRSLLSLPQTPSLSPKACIRPSPPSASGLGASPRLLGVSIDDDPDRPGHRPCGPFGAIPLPNTSPSVDISRPMPRARDEEPRGTRHRSHHSVGIRRTRGEWLPPRHDHCTSPWVAWRGGHDSALSPVRPLRHAVMA